MIDRKGDTERIKEKLCVCVRMWVKEREGEREWEREREAGREGWVQGDEIYLDCDAFLNFEREKKWVVKVRKQPDAFICFTL